MRKVKCYGWFKLGKKNWVIRQRTKLKITGFVLFLLNMDLIWHYSPMVLLLLLALRKLSKFFLTFSSTQIHGRIRICWLQSLIANNIPLSHLLISSFHFSPCPMDRSHAGWKSIRWSRHELLQKLTHASSYMNVTCHLG